MADEEIRTNPVTGQRFHSSPSRWKTYSPEEIPTKRPVEGLKAFAREAGLIHFEWRRAGTAFQITEEEAKEAQTAAGWDVNGYGFYGFHVEGAVATWVSGASCD